MISCKFNCPKFSLLLIAVLASGFIIVSFDKYYFPHEEHHHYIYINVSRAIFETDEEFLSLGIDTSFMRTWFHKFNSSDWTRLADYARLLTPAYIRLGGTAADQVLFTANDVERQEKYLESFDDTDNDYFAKENLSPKDYLNISGDDWLKFNEFMNRTNGKLLFDVNVLLRDGRDWDGQNARDLISFSEAHGIPMDFQLGNEPNSFLHVFNVSISGRQLGMDFASLRQILNSSEAYKKSKLVGPDVTRPREIQQSSIEYLRDFMSTAKDLSAVSWHHYYLNGRNASLGQFTDPKVFNVFPRQIAAMTEVVREFSPDVPIWLTETASAYGGGAPGLSDRFADAFLWLDKLGMAARHGIKVVVRQSLFQGYYALVDEDFYPLPDYWISYFYKLLVGRKVFKVLFVKNEEESHLRFYCHCLKRNHITEGNVVLYGMNLGNESEFLIPGGLKSDHPITSLTFTAPDDDLRSKAVLLNGQVLRFHGGDNDLSIAEFFKPSVRKLPLFVPPHSIVFWIFHDEREGPCADE